ncbi:MAG: alpha-N-acetylglucosaminidase C-terminal domain-containing protein, partial [Bacteroidales bacterium]|nr:alpha-N-acetylglucosaminidase C-terminal domain-containing protein [Candidatus Cryptobacteroides aphodequi]
IDPFNEVTPPSWEASYLARVGRQIYDSVAAADPEAIWLQMGWIFTYQRQNWTDERIEAYLGATPKDKQIILDYYCESTEVWPQTKSFFGTPYIWCYLGNFGGNPYMDGSFRTLEDRFENCYTNGGDNLVGIGCTLEGLDTNPYVYQYVLEKAWNSDITADIEIWTDALADQRTGKADAHARKAWHTLVDSIYVDESSAGLKFQIELLRPIFKTRTWVYSKNNLDKEIRILTDVLGQLVQADGKGDAYEFDLANISRQMLMCRFSALYRDYEKACNAGNWDELKPLSEQMLTNLDELEKVCATSLEFSLGKWIEDARRFGVDEAEKDYFETNARNLITSWAPNMHYGLNDYAHRPYDGLIATYYKPRWEMFFEMMDAERDNFDWDAFNERSFSLERAWWAECQGSFKASTRGDIRKIAESLYNKYQKQ